MPGNTLAVSSQRPANLIPAPQTVQDHDLVPKGSLGIDDGDTRNGEIKSRRVGTGVRHNSTDRIGVERGLCARFDLDRFGDVGVVRSDAWVYQLQGLAVIRVWLDPDRRRHQSGARTGIGADCREVLRHRSVYPASEKLEIIRIVEQSHLPAKRTLDQLGIARRTFYRWYDRYLEGGPEALEDRPSAPSRVWNRIAPEVQDQIVEMALDQSELSPRELAVRFTDERQYFVSEATVYRLLKAHDLITSPAYVVIKAADQFHTRTTRPNEMWQTDFTYFKIIGWGWMYLSTVLDDFSRYIIAWKLCTNMRAEDVTDTLDLALAASGCDKATALHKPRLLSDNGPSYIAGELAEYIEAQKMSHVCGAPMHPQTQGKIERWHQTLKNRILLENYFLPGDLEIQIEAFVEHYNHQRYHESLSNVTPADAYFGRAPAIIKQRERIKQQTIEYRRLQHRKLAA